MSVIIRIYIISEHYQHSKLQKKKKKKMEKMFRHHWKWKPDLPGLKRIIVLKNAYSTKSSSSFSRLSSSSFTLNTFSRTFWSLVNKGLCSSSQSDRSMWTAASVNNGDRGNELEHCETPNMKRSDHELCSKTSWSALSKLRKAWMFLVQSTVRNRRRVAIS